MGDALRETIGGSVGAVFCTYAGIPFDVSAPRRLIAKLYSKVGHLSTIANNGQPWPT